MAIARYSSLNFTPQSLLRPLASQSARGLNSQGQRRFYKIHGIPKELPKSSGGQPVGFAFEYIPLRLDGLKMLTPFTALMVFSCVERPLLADQERH